MEERGALPVRSIIALAGEGEVRRGSTNARNVVSRSSFLEPLTGEAVTCEVGNSGEVSPSSYDVGGSSISTALTRCQGRRMVLCPPHDRNPDKAQALAKSAFAFLSWTEDQKGRLTLELHRSWL